MMQDEMNDLNKVSTIGTWVSPENVRCYSVVWVADECIEEIAEAVVKKLKGVCDLYFPRGYVGRKPPHPARAVGHCFQWEGKT